MGKLLYIFGSEGQWDVVGVSLSSSYVWDTLSLLVQDTFVVGCKFSDKIIYPDTFVDNPDYNHEVYSTENGIYKPHCGLDNVMLSWGHDEVRLCFNRQDPMSMECLSSCLVSLSRREGAKLASGGSPCDDSLSQLLPVCINDSQFFSVS